jgi:hypothetical protein
MYRIQVAVPEVPSGLNPLGLLVPIPPDTLHQSLESLVCPDHLSPHRCCAEDSTQTALFLAGRSGANVTFEFRFGPSRGEPPPSHFLPAVNRYIQPSSELIEGLNQLTEGASGEREKLTRIIAFTASLFDYDHPPVKFYEGKDAIPLLRDITKGSCLDINTFLMSSLYVAGIPAAYYAGYFFEAGKSPVSRRFHCWVATLTDGEQQDWDVAHHITAGTRDVNPGLNPKAGIRFAMSRGRGLNFRLAGHDLWISHLGDPVWIEQDGGHERVEAVATLREAGDPYDPGKRIPVSGAEIRV